MNQTFGFEISRKFPFSAATLYQAMLSAEVLKSLWGLDNLTVSNDGDTRSAYAEMRINNEDWNFKLVYDDLLENELLRWKVYFDRFPGKEVHVSLAFEENGDETTLTAGQSNFDSEQERDANKQAWQQSLEKLESLLA